MLQVAAFTPGDVVPSARFRVRQYIPALRNLGINVHEAPARFGAYPPACKPLRPAWACANLAERLNAALSLRRADVTLLQRQMLSKRTTVERFTRAPRVLDVDDAIWLAGEGPVVSLAQMCDAVICGNSFIAEFFSRFVRTISIVPTAVDTIHVRPPATPKAGDSKVICWSGTSSGLPYLYAIERELRSVLSRDPRRRLRVVSDQLPQFKELPWDRVEFVRWSPEVEVTAIHNAAVGIMPLSDSPWARGKCSYKLLTYMACGIPAIASPIGMNAEVLGAGNVGFAARTAEQWIDALEFVLTSPETAAATASAGRELVLRKYSVEVLAPKLASSLVAAGHA